MPGTTFLPGPGDTLAGSPLAQMGALMSILRENKESQARIGQLQAETQDAVARGQLAQQQAALLGLEVKDFPMKQQEQSQLIQSQIGETQARTAQIGQQSELAALLAPGQLSLQQGQLGVQQSEMEMHQATAQAEQARQRQEDYHTQQLQDADKELRSNSDYLMSQLGFEGPAKKFNLNFVTAPIIQDLAKTQAQTRLYKQHGDMYEALSQKATDWRQVQEDRIKNSGTNKNLQTLAQLAKINPAAASAYENDSDPVVSAAAKIIAKTPKTEKPESLNQLQARIMAQVYFDPSADEGTKAKALMWMAQANGQKPDIVPQSYDMQTGVETPAHYDWSGFNARMADYAKSIVTQLPPTTAPSTPVGSNPSTQPSRVSVIAPDGTPGTIRPDQIDEARRQGYTIK